MAGANEVVLAERGWRNEARLPVSGAVASWAVANPGQFSAFARTADLRDIGVSDPDELGGMWLRWEHPGAGDWGGVVSAASVGSGHIEITAEDFRVLLRKRLTSSRPTPLAAPAGAVFEALMRQASRAEPTYLRVAEVDADLPFVRFEFAAQDIGREAIPAVAQAAGCEWAVTAEPATSFVRRLGRDKSGEVRLVDVLDLAGDQRYVVDFSAISNRLLGTGARPDINLGLQARRKRKRRPYPTATVADDASVGRHGPLEEARDYPDTLDRGAVVGRLSQEIGRSKEPARTLEVTVLEASGKWPLFREGDTVRVELSAEGIVADLRIEGRSVDAVAGTQTIAGPATRLAVPREVAFSPPVIFYVTNVAFDILVANDQTTRVRRG